jgi:hypothetical protein
MNGAFCAVRYQPAFMQSLNPDEGVLIPRKRLILVMAEARYVNACASKRAINTPTPYDSSGKLVSVFGTHEQIARPND